MKLPKYIKPPAAVRKYMLSTREESEADVAIYIRRAVAAYKAVPSRGVTLDGYIAIRLSCTPFQAARAIKWAQEPKP